MLNLIPFVAKAVTSALVTFLTTFGLQGDMTIEAAIMSLVSAGLSFVAVYYTTNKSV